MARPSFMAGSPALAIMHSPCTQSTLSPALGSESTPQRSLLCRIASCCAGLGSCDSSSGSRRLRPSTPFPTCLPHLLGRDGSALPLHQAHGRVSHRLEARLHLSMDGRMDGWMDVGGVLARAPPPPPLPPPPTTRACTQHNGSYHGGLDAVKPGALVVLPRGREGRARELLRVQPCREGRKDGRMSSDRATTHTVATRLTKIRFLEASTQRSDCTYRGGRPAGCSAPAARRPAPPRWRSGSRSRTGTRAAPASASSHHQHHFLPLPLLLLLRCSPRSSLMSMPSSAARLPREGVGLVGVGQSRVDLYVSVMQGGRDSLCESARRSVRGTRPCQARGCIKNNIILHTSPLPWCQARVRSEKSENQR